MGSVLPLELCPNHMIHVLRDWYLALALVKQIKNLLNLIHVFNALIFQHSDQLEPLKKPIFIFVDDLEALYDLIEERFFIESPSSLGNYCEMRIRN